VEDRKFICPCYRHEQDIAETGHCICRLFVTSDYQPPKIDSPAEASEDSEWPRIIVYGASWCTDTMGTRKYLNLHGVPYIFVDVDQEPAAAREVQEWNRGQLATPTLDVDGQIVTEPSDEELGELLGIGEG
jgi:glutaredoxin